MIGNKSVYDAKANRIPSDSGGILPRTRESFARLRQISEQIEFYIEDVCYPIKSYLPIFARLLIVATFLEDSLRLVTQWRFQKQYLKVSNGWSNTTTSLFLLLNIFVMIPGSVMVILGNKILVAVCMLLSIIPLQAFGYHLFKSKNFIFRNLSISGGLLLLLSDYLLRNSKSKSRDIFFNLTSSTLSPQERHKYVILAGRILLLFLFIGAIHNTSLSIFGIFKLAFSIIVLTMVAVGFKARWSAMMLVLFLSIINFIGNNWWTGSAHSRDFLRYDFFQTLSVIGGFLILATNGPGNLSIDEKKKSF